MALPTFVQGAAGASSLGETQTTYTLNLPNKVLSGNAVIVAVVIGSPETVTVTDDQGNTYTQEVTNNDGNADIFIFVALNITNSPRQIILSPNGADYVDAVALEFYNIATSSAVDKTFSNSGSGTTVTAGSQTTTVDGDLIFQFAVQDGSAAGQIWTEGSGWTGQLATPFIPSKFAQTQVQTTHGAINPTCTNNNSDTWNSIGIALKSASAGTAPSSTAIRVVRYQCIQLEPSFVTPAVFQLPSSGNLTVTASIWPVGLSISGITDNLSNSYSAVAAPYDSTYAELQIFYAKNAATGPSQKLTCNTTGSSAGGATIHVFDIANAAALPLDTTAGLPGGGAQSELDGDQVSAGNLAAQSINPTNPNELVISLLGVTSNNVIGISPGYFMCPTPGTFGADDSIAQNDGCAIEYTATPSSHQYTWTQSGGAYGGWVSISAAFMPATTPGDTVTESLVYRYHG
jgi:hypothetical protein